jgi:hypothetical protein
MITGGRKEFELLDMRFGLDNDDRGERRDGDGGEGEAGKNGREESDIGRGVVHCDWESGRID